MKIAYVAVSLVPILLASPLAMASCRDLIQSNGVAPTDTSATSIRVPEGAYGAPRPWSDSKHTGVDIVLNQSSATNAAYEVKAMGSGTVAYSRDNGAYGNVVIIDHGDDCYSLYAHLASTAPRTPMTPGGDALVKVGAPVIAGQIVGYMRNIAVDTDSSGNAQKLSDATARTQVHVALFESPSKSTSATKIRPNILKSASDYVNPTDLLVRAGLSVP